MDPLSAIAVASAVVQFLDIGFKVAHRLSEYDKASQNEVPQSLRSINVQLPLLLNSLARVKSDVSVKKFDTDTRCILRGVVSGCTSLANDVEAIIGKVARQEGESAAVKLKKAFASFKHEEKIKSIDKNLQTYIQVLILHHVVDSADVPTAPPEDVQYFDVREKAAEPFYLRSDLVRKLDKAFYDTARSQKKTLTVVVLTGEKGVGKSQVALDYCHQSNKAKQFQTVFWLNAETPESLELSLESIAGVIQRSTVGSKSEKLAFVNHFLGNRWHPWLLVLDNYNHKSYEQRNVLSYLPADGYGAVLITTRNLAASALGEAIVVSKYLTFEEEEDLRHTLTAAVEQKQMEKVRRVVERGYNVNQVDSNGWPFVTRAALMCLEEAVDLFLNKGACIDLKPNMDTPLEWAARKGSVSIVTRLLNHEDKHAVRLKFERYENALRQALDKGHTEVARTLLSRRQVKLDVKDWRGDPIFATVAANGHIDSLHLLIGHNIIPQTDEVIGQTLCNVVKKPHLEVLKLLVAQQRLSPNTVDEYGHTPLLYAAEHNEDISAELVRFLIDAGADPNLTGPNGDKNLPLHSAALRDHTAITRMLLDAGAEHTREDHLGFTPILKAAKFNSPKAVDMLLTVPITDAEKRKAYQDKILQYSARNGMRELMLGMLRAAGSSADELDINHKDWRGQTPLMLTIAGKYVPAARLLIRYGARQDIKDNEGRLPLLWSAEIGLELVVRDLLKAKNSPGPEGVRDKQGNTALHVATAAGKQEVVQVLLDAGADKEAENDYGEMALDIAEEKKLKSVVEMLQ